MLKEILNLYLLTPIRRWMDRVFPLKIKPRSIFLILFLLLLALCIYSIPQGHFKVGFTEAYHNLYKTIMGLVPDWWTQSDRFVAAGEYTRDERVSRILLQNYLPRTAGAVLVGASLAAAGSVYQGIFRNPLVSPDLLGASAGAAFGGALGLFLNGGTITTTTMLYAFVFGMLAVGIVYLVSLSTQGEQNLTLLLGGVMIGSLFHAGITALKTFAPDDDVLPSITYWLMGAISPGFKLQQLKYLVIPVAVGLFILMLMRWKFNLLTVGEEEARSMGINPTRVKGMAIIGATLVTSASVALCGTIGWVGLVIPHFVRRLVGPDFRVLLPASMLVGGIAVLLLDNLVLIGTRILPMGVYTGFIGVPFYLALLMDRRQRS